MFKSLIFVLAGALVSQAMAANYTYMPGFFVTDDPNANSSTIGPLPNRFGLLDQATGYWPRFQQKIEQLNQEGSVKVFYLGRHGEGFHNVGEAKYGTPAWNAYWSKLDGDGNITWGPDALLTDLGTTQAQNAHKAWLSEISAGIPFPTQFYSSPLSRAAKTCEITWTGIIISDNNGSFHSEKVSATEGNRAGHPEVMISENCREMYGEHTCDQRHNKTWIESSYPEFRIEPGFTEQDELWTTTRETYAHVQARANAFIDQVWKSHREEHYISVTAHSGFINGFLEAVGRGSYGLPTGGLIPIVVKTNAG